MDKTGTITKGNFVVQEIVPESEISKDELLCLAAACEKNSTHPIAVSIVERAAEKALELPQVSESEEISGKGIRAVVEGREILCGNKKLMEL